jgi:MFS family permease
VFLINTVTFLALLASLWKIPTASLRPLPRAAPGKGRIREGLRYVRFRPDIVVVLVAIFIVGTLGLNFVLFIAAMVGTEFGLDAGAFGLMNSIMAIGSVAGALLSARRSRPRLRIIFGAAAAFGVASGLAALAPSYLWFGVALVPVGLFALTMLTSANGYVQTTTDPVMRGRVMALYMAIFMGGTPIGAPLVGWAANVAGARWALAVAAAAGLLAAAIGLVWIIRPKTLRVRVNRQPRGLPRVRLVSMAGADPRAGTADGAGRDASPDDAVED